MPPPNRLCTLRVARLPVRILYVLDEGTAEAVTPRLSGHCTLDPLRFSIEAHRAAIWAGEPRTRQGQPAPWRTLLVLYVARLHTHPRFCYSLYNCSNPPGIARQRGCVMRRLKPIVAVAATLAAILGERWLRSKMHQLG